MNLTDRRLISALFVALLALTATTTTSTTTATSTTTTSSDDGNSESQGEPEVPSGEEADDGETHLREKREYGGGGGYGGGGYGGGSYGCHCPYQSCDNNNDMLLYFSAGALLGLLFSMLTTAAPAPAPAPAPGRQASGAPTSFFDPAFLGTLPNMLSGDVAPLALDMVNVYSASSKHPGCARRWLCEVTRDSYRHGGLRARLTSISSVAVSWLLKDMMPYLENISDSPEDLDCSVLAPACVPYAERDTMT